MSLPRNLLSASEIRDHLAASACENHTLERADAVLAQCSSNTMVTVSEVDIRVAIHINRGRLRRQSAAKHPVLGAETLLARLEVADDPTVAMGVLCINGWSVMVWFDSKLLHLIGCLVGRDARSLRGPR